jgi:hypothetical protein
MGRRGREREELLEKEKKIRERLVIGEVASTEYPINVKTKDKDRL